MTIAVIGADEESVHAIRQAKKQGLKVVAVDQNPEAPGLVEADIKINIPISDEAKVIDALREQQIDLVLTAPIGRHISTIGAVNDALGLPGITWKAAQECSDKYSFHTRLRNLKLRTGHCYLVNRNQHINPEQIQFPAVFKPRYGSHGRSVHMLETPEDYISLEKYIWGDSSDSVIEIKTGKDAAEFLAMLKKTLNDKKRLLNGEDDPNLDYILEDAIPGTEYGVDGVVEGCNFELVLLRRKIMTPPPARQAVAYLSVPEYDEHRITTIVKEYMRKLCQVMNYKDCMLHADVIVCGSKCMAVEVSSSPAGSHIYDEFLPMSTGVDMCAQYLTYMRGEIHNFSPLNMKKMMMHFFDMENCFIHKVPKQEEIIEKLPDRVKLRRWECNIILLDYMGRITDENSLLSRGYYILEGPDDRTLLRAAEIIRDEFEVK